MMNKKIAFLSVALGLLCSNYGIAQSDPFGFRGKMQALAGDLVKTHDVGLRNMINVPYNHGMFYAAHNAYATTADKYSLAGPNQKKPFLAQIAQYSARAVELDAWPKGDGVNLCHSECGKAGMAMLRPFHDQGEPLERYLKYIVTFLDGQSRESGDLKELNDGKDKDGQRYFNLPQAQAFLRALRTYVSTGDKAAIDATGWEPLAGMAELLRRPPIITIMFEDYVEDGSKTDAIIEQSGLAPYVLKPSDWDAVSQGGWPAMSSMILSGKVVVILSNKRKNRPTKYMFDLWDYSWEGPFSEDAGANFKEMNMEACKTVQNRGTYFTKYLLTLHHHAFTPTARDHGSINSSVANFMQKCFAIGGIGGTVDRYPNFILSDMVHEGDVYTNALRGFFDQYMQKLYALGKTVAAPELLPDDGNLHADNRFKDDQPLGQGLRMRGLGRDDVKIPDDLKK